MKPATPTTPQGRLETVNEPRILGVDLTAHGDGGWGSILADLNGASLKTRRPDRHTAPV